MAERKLENPPVAGTDVGLRPHFADRLYPHRGGASSKFANGTQLSVTNESEFACDWVIKFRPSSDAVGIVGDGVNAFGMTGTVNANYDGEQSLEYQPAANPNASQFILPLVGKCFQVHGRTIVFTLRRTAPGATKELGIEWAVIPGQVGRWFVSDAAFATNFVPALFPIPVFATRFQFFADVAAGDTIVQLAADGVTGLQTVAAGNNANFLQPIHPRAAFVSYGTLAALKSVVCGFEVIS